jgi:hypothetical protein
MNKKQQMNMKQLLTATLPILWTLISQAQHPHNHEHTTPRKDTAKQVAQAPMKKEGAMSPMNKKAAQDTVPQNHTSHNNSTQPATHDHGAMQTEGHDHARMNMSHAFSRNLPMTRNGSGTSWNPDNSPMYGYMFHKGPWMYMVHGNMFLRYNKQDLLDKGSRGGAKFDAPNMVMFMGQRTVGKNGLFHFSTMASLDPITVGGEGYPLLFQTGESYKGKPLVDRQHPHDLISELSVSYAHSLSKKADVFLYVGYPGEPALGPAAFVHRPSGFFNPDAPLSHHWVDATHITFGVATLGVRYGNWKLEGSSFTGREPGENRYSFDKPLFNSWSGRLSFNPTAKWALQASHGFIKEPEALHPGEDVNRTTASATYSTRGYAESFTNVTALWGMNKTKGHQGEHAVLVEGSRNVRKTAVYGRYEWVQKSVEELNLIEAVFGHDALFPVHAFTAGASYDIFMVGNTKVALGGQFTLFNPDKRLSSLYGQNPLAGQVYLRIYPRAMGDNRVQSTCPTK